jgi:ATP-dependent Clp protease ATP-binding subunit ClpC
MNLHAVSQELNKETWRGEMPVQGTGEIFYTPRCARLAGDAGKLAERLGNSAPTGAHLLLAILADSMAAPSRVMDELGFKRGELIEQIRGELVKKRGKRAKGGGQAAQAQAEQRRVPEVSSPTREAGTAEDEPRPSNDAILESVTRDLTELAREGKIDPAIGRDKEILMVLEILQRRNKNNAILVGEAGVGKTKVAEGLAVAAAKGAFGQETQNTRMIELNVAALMSGTQYRGAFEEKVTAILEELKNREDVVLFIDEIHLIMGAGATGEGGMDLANLLKPALARGELRCIGATTMAEYRKFIEKDPALERRFQMVRVEAMTEAATYQVLKKMKPTLEKHHGVEIMKEAIQASIQLTERYMPNRNLPDKAIDVLDQACARYRLRAVVKKSQASPFDSDDGEGDIRITPQVIRSVISHTTSIPIEEISQHERMLLGNLERKLRRQIIGQDEAVTKAAAAVKKSRAGLADPNRPDAVLLFLGPTGVGKTQLAKSLAHFVFGSSDDLITFDMSEYIESHSVSRLLGAPPGYVGAEEEGRLASAVRSKPFSIILFDEVEKAHRNVFDIFLPILDEGRIKDSRDREVSFKNSILIFTSNIGAHSLYREQAGGYSKELMKDLRKHFRPEFINRIDDIVPFYPLMFEDTRAILHLNFKELNNRLKEQGMRLRVCQGAYEYLAEVGYSEEFGARELRRAVDQHVVNTVSAMILDGKFERGDIVEVLMLDEKLSFRKGAPREKGSVASA